MKSSENWISSAIKKPGALRKTLKVKKGEDITESKLKKAEQSKNSTTRKRVFLSDTLKKFSKDR